MQYYVLKCYLLIFYSNYYSADTWAAVWIAVMTVGTMFPMSVYSGKILLQVGHGNCTCSSHCQ